MFRYFFILLFIYYDVVCAANQSDLTVYDDFLENGWSNEATVPANFRTKEIVYEGKYSISFTPQIDRDFRLSCPDHCMDTLLYTSLDFYLMLLQNEPISDIVINFYEKNILISSNSLSQLYPGILEITDRWLFISMSFSAIGIPSGMALTGFSIEGGISTSGTNKLFLDEIILDGIHANFDPSAVIKTNSDGFIIYTEAISVNQHQTKFSITGDRSTNIEPSVSYGGNEGEQWLLSAFSLFIFCSVLGIIAIAAALLLLLKKGYVIVHEDDVKSRGEPPSIELKEV